jgi:xanthosine utilization system XapX-like protein
MAPREPVMTTSKTVSKPVAALFGMVGALIGGMVLKRTWKLLAHREDAPDAGDVERGWGEVLAAAALRGAIAGAVKAALHRGYLIRRGPHEPEPDQPHRSPDHRRHPVLGAGR